jgi:hypothetical protein
MPNGLRWHFDSLGMPKEGAPKVLRSQLKKETVSFTVGCEAAEILPAEEGGTRKFFLVARARGVTTGTILDLGTPDGRSKTNPEGENKDDC